MMFTGIWTFITKQFAFSQAGASQSWLFWFVVAVGIAIRLRFLLLNMKGKK